MENRGQLIIQRDREVAEYEVFSGSSDIYTNGDDIMGLRMLFTEHRSFLARNQWIG